MSKIYEKPDHIDINRVNDKVKYEPNEATHRFLGITPIGINCFGSPWITCLFKSLKSGITIFIATPPNAVVFDSGYLKITDMIKAGFWMNLGSIIILTLIVYFLLPLLWDLDKLAL